MRAVHDVVGKWKGIARCLRVKDIDQIEKDYRGVGKRMIAVLSAWLQGQTLDNEPPSWKKVVWVVADHVGGGNPAHAEHIFLNYHSEHISLLLLLVLDAKIMDNYVIIC